MRDRHVEKMKEYSVVRERRSQSERFSKSIECIC